MEALRARLDSGMDLILAKPENRVTSLHPGNQVANSGLYCNADNAVNEAVPVEVTRGRFQASANSLTMPGTSAFQIPPSSILSQCWLNASVDTDRYVNAPSGWLLHLVEQVTFSIAGASTLNNVQIDGGTYKSLILTACDNQEKREAILECSGDYLNGNAAALTDQQASIPLWFPWSSPDVDGCWPLDSSTVPGNIIIQIKWKNPYEVFYGTSGQTVTLPVAFNEVGLKAKMMDIVGPSQFSVANAQALDQTLPYYIPYLYCSSFSKIETVTSGTVGIIQLQQIPAGQLVAILIEPIVASQVGVPAHSNVVTGGSLIQDLVNLRLTGQDIIKYDSIKEQQLVDTISTNGNAYRYTTTSGTSYADPSASTYTNAVTVLPLMIDLENVFLYKKTENVPTYGGGILEYRYRIDGYSLSAAQVTFKVTYVINGIISITNRLVQPIY